MRIDDLSGKELVQFVKTSARIAQINKDKIFVCKDCEYRYMCSDPRIPTEVSNTGYYVHDSDCYYNPFIGKWEGEEGYIPATESHPALSLPPSSE